MVADFRFFLDCCGELYIMTHKMTGSRSNTWALIPDILKYDQLSYCKTQVSYPSVKVNSTYHWVSMRMKRGSKYTDCAQCLKDHRHPNIFVHPFSSKLWNFECKCGLWNLNLILILNLRHPLIFSKKFIYINYYNIHKAKFTMSGIRSEMTRCAKAAWYLQSGYKSTNQNWLRNDRKWNLFS